jgi:integrase/recombinase XerD
MRLGPSIIVKIILFKGKTHADGTHPIMLEHYIDGKTKRKVLHRCKPDQWDQANRRVRGKVSNSAFINNLISTAFCDAERNVLQIKSGDAPLQSLFESAKPITLGEAFDKELTRLKKDLKNVPYERVSIYKHQLSTFCKIDSLRLADIDLTWFENVARHMRDLGNGGSTIQKKIKTIRALIQRYSDKRLSMDICNYRVPVQKTVRQKLTKDEFKKIESLSLQGELLLWCRDFFVLQVYLRGARVGSLLQATNDQFRDGRYFAISNQEGKNNVSCKLVPAAQAIVDRYQGKYERLFPFFKWAPNGKLSAFENNAIKLAVKESCTTTINSCLKKIAAMANIDKPISTHIARHTYARMAIDKINNPMVTMDLLGHTSLAVHQAYLNDIRRDDVLDQANDEIFN